MPRGGRGDFRGLAAIFEESAAPGRYQRAIVDSRSGESIQTNPIDQFRDVDMREVPASQAKTHLPQLLDDVERGETIVITRHGRPIARIVPEAERRQDEIDQAIADLKEFGKQTGRATVEDVLSLVREGRKY